MPSDDANPEKTHRTTTFCVTLYFMVSELVAY